MADPLILTAAFDPISAHLFQRLRDAHFPPVLNRVPAHLTLFHHLPGEHVAGVVDRLCVNPPRRPLPFVTAGLRFLGRGVAIEVGCPPLAALHQALADAWQGWLTAQDRQAFRPHVTVQNKVPPAEARALLDDLRRALEPTEGTIVGLDLWWYRGGPWERTETFRWGSD